MSLPEPPKPFDHWMLAEIFEQPQSLQATLDRYIADGTFRSDTTKAVQTWLTWQHELFIVASGSSRHAGMVGMAAIEGASPLRVTVEFASEYIARAVHLKPPAGLVVLSQSGETADTLAALRSAKQQGMSALAVTNAGASTMVREATLSMPIEAGRERAIPATKSFTGQVLVLQIMSLLAAAGTRTLDDNAIATRLKELCALPSTVKAQLEGWRSAAERAARSFQSASSFLFLGRGAHYPIALEGALKLKESAYIHAEGYPAGELKHGPNALVSERAPLVFLATVDRKDTRSVALYGKTLQLMRDMRAQGAGMIAVGNANDTEVQRLADVFIAVNAVSEPLLPVCEVIPLQLLAYSFAIGKGIDVDRPRKLVKAVVVE